MIKKWMRIFAPTVAIAVVAAAGIAALGGKQANAQSAVEVGGSRAAQVRAIAPSATPSATADAETNDDAGETPDSQDQTDEATESAALAGKASVTVEQARAAALAANPGTTVSKVDLDDENGTIVYSVELNTGVDVKVDAVSGAVIASDTEQANEAADSETQD